MLKINISREQLINELGVDDEEDLTDELIEETFWNTVDGIMGRRYSFPECQWQGEGDPVEWIEEWMRKIHLTIDTIVAHAKRRPDRYLKIGTEQDIINLLNEMWQDEIDYFLDGYGPTPEVVAMTRI